MKPLTEKQQKLLKQFREENDANLHSIIGGKQFWDDGHIIAKMVLKEREEVKAKSDRNTRNHWYQKPIGIITMGVVIGLLTYVAVDFIKPFFESTPQP